MNSPSSISPRQTRPSSTTSGPRMSSRRSRREDLPTFCLEALLWRSRSFPPLRPPRDNLKPLENCLSHNRKTFSSTDQAPAPRTRIFTPSDMDLINLSTNRNPREELLYFSCFPLRPPPDPYRFPITYLPRGLDIYPLQHFENLPSATGSALWTKHFFCAL